MAIELVRGTFEPLVGEKFTARPSDEGGEATELELELASCVESPHAQPDHPAFSLFFRVTAGALLPQQIFTLENDALGEFELFLVAVGPQQYEAVVN
jgi:hypothetical protein